VLVALWIKALLYIVTFDGQFGSTISLNMLIVVIGYYCAEPSHDTGTLAGASG
jgi:hypothetical protein